MVGPEFLYVVVGAEVHRVAFRNVTSVVEPGRSSARRRLA